MVIDETSKTSKSKTAIRYSIITGCDVRYHDDINILSIFASCHEEIKIVKYRLLKLHTVCHLIKVQMYIIIACND